MFDALTELQILRVTNSENYSTRKESECMLSIFKAFEFPYQRKDIYHALLYSLIRNSNIKWYIDKCQEDPTFPLSRIDQFQLAPIGKNEARKLFFSTFKLELSMTQVNTAFEKFVHLNLMVPVDNFYLINLPYIARALSNRDLQEFFNANCSKT